MYTCVTVSAGILLRVCSSLGAMTRGDASVMPRPFQKGGKDREGNGGSVDLVQDTMDCCIIYVW